MSGILAFILWNVVLYINPLELSNFAKHANPIYSELKLLETWLEKSPLRASQRQKSKYELHEKEKTHYATKRWNKFLKSFILNRKLQKLCEIDPVELGVKAAKLMAFIAIENGDVIYTGFETVLIFKVSNFELNK